MSSIDSYSYTCIGVIECPTAYRLFVGQENIQPIDIAIYHLEQNIPVDEDDFQGKTGDILVGGGGGEAPAMLIRIPDALIFYANFENTDYEVYLQQKYEYIFDQHPFLAYWTPTQSYILGAGYETLGWNPEQDRIEGWLTHHVLAFLKKYYSDQFKIDKNQLYLTQDGSICRQLTNEEDKFWNWKKYKYGSST